MVYLATERDNSNFSDGSSSQLTEYSATGARAGAVVKCRVAPATPSIALDNKFQTHR